MPTDARVGETFAKSFSVLTQRNSPATKNTWSNKTNDELIRDYVSLIAGGLAGTTSLASATILALSKITFAFRLEMPQDVAQLILENICLMSALPDREVVGSTLAYMKVFTVAFPKDKVLPYVPTLMNAVLSMTDDCKNHFRLKTRDVIDRLLRKFGYDLLQSLVPPEDVIMHKRLKNLKKINAKKKANRLLKEKDEEEDVVEEFASRAKPKSIEEILASSDESDAESESKSSRKTAKDRSEMFIQEDEENIIDLISPSASSKISAVKPMPKKEKKQSDFKYTEDGRMIIVDDPEEEEDDDSDDDDDDDDSDIGGLSKKLNSVSVGRKRKLSSSSEVPAKYQAGGSGIHRPIKHSDTESVKSLGRKKKKQKKNEVPNLKTGKEYRAKKAKGDVKLKGKPDPYAYIPLSRKMLNRRKKVKNIVKSAIKGAKIGSKLKMKKRRQQ